MTAQRRVYDSRHLQADCQEPGSAPEPCSVIGNIHKKFGEYRMCSSKDMIMDKHTNTDRQTDRHAHYNTPLPYRGRSSSKHTQTMGCAINQSIYLSINQSIDQSINQSINRSINKSINWWINQSLNQNSFIMAWQNAGQQLEAKRQYT